MPIDGFAVIGLKELRKELKAASTAFPKELRTVNLAAAQTIADATAASFAADPHVSHLVAPTVKALAQQVGGQVRIGGDSAPMTMGAEFGSVKYKQFPPWRGSGPGAGYHLYETLRNKQPDIVERYGVLLDQLMRKAFPD